MALRDTRYLVETTPPLRPEQPKPMSQASITAGLRPRSIARSAAERPVYPPPTMTTSALAAPERRSGAAAAFAVSRQSEDGGVSADMVGIPMDSGTSGFLSSVGELLERCEVEVGLRDRLRNGRATKTLQVVAALDPADLVPEFSRDADVVILALRDVQDLLLLEAVRGLPAEIEEEKARIGLGVADLVERDAVVERTSQLVGATGVGDSVVIRHGDQAEPAPQTPERVGRIRKGGGAEEHPEVQIAGGIV